MKLLHAIVCALLTISSANATNYYFSALSGDDSRTSVQAQKPTTPWKTLNKLNSFFSNLQPGDSVFFKKAETYYGHIIVSKSGSSNLPIVIAAYGNGSKPVISGFAVPANWTSTADSIWKGDCSTCDSSLNFLLINSEQYAAGRFPNLNTPNNGYLTLESHVANQKIIDLELPNTPNWTGADVVIRKNRWIIDKHKIARHTGNAIEYNSRDLFSYTPTDKYGYFIQNHPATLDLFGEWYYNPATKEIRLHTGKLNPINLTIQVSTTNRLVDIQHQSNLNFRNLCFTGSNETSMFMEDVQHIKVDSCEFNYSGKNAISAYISNYLTIENNIITNANNDAIIANSSSNTIIRGNIVKNTGLFRGRGSNNDDAYQAIILRGNTNLIEYNEVDSTGYIPIRFEGNAVTVKNNFIKNFCLVKDDGGGIYTWQAGDDTSANYDRNIIGNIILNGRGDGTGTSDSTYKAAEGIYCDGRVGHVAILNNSVANCTQAGLYFNNPHDHIITGNTSFNNGSQIMMAHIAQNPNTFSGNNYVSKNTFVSKQTYQYSKTLESVHDDIYTMSNSDSNYYCRPLDDNFVINCNSNYSGSNTNDGYNLQQWRNLTGQDQFTKKSPLQIPPYNIISTSNTNKFTNGAFSTTVNNVYVSSPSESCTQSWENGALDNGCLKLSFNKSTNPSESDRNAYITFEIGNVSSLKNYIVRFSLKGKKDLRNFQVFLRKKENPYTDLSKRYHCNLTINRTENEFAFVSPITESEAFLVLQVNEEDSTFWIDNLKVTEAQLNITNPDDYIRFEYNASSNNKVVNLNGNTYLDMKGVEYQDSLSIGPWSSIALLKNNQTVLPIELLKLTGKLINKQVVLEWPMSGTVDEEIYYIQKTTENNGFKTVGALTSSQYNNSCKCYQYIDYSPSIKNYYRVQRKNKNGNIITSDILFIANQQKGVIIMPNPAKNYIEITMPQGIKDFSMITITSLKGEQLKKVFFKSESNFLRLDVSSLVRGVYILNVVNEQGISNVKFDKL